MSAAAGHLNHPYELYKYTTSDFSTLIDNLIININEYNPVEKIDGFNLHLSYKDDKVIIARNKTDLAKKDKTIEYYKNHFIEKNIFNVAIILEQACLSFERYIINNNITNIFNEGEIWVNVEIVSPFTSNILIYNENSIFIHNFVYLANDKSYNINDFFKVENKQYGIFDIKLPVKVYVNNTDNFKKEIAEKLFIETNELKKELSCFNTLLDYYINNYKKIIKNEYVLYFKHENINNTIIYYLIERFKAIILKESLPNFIEFKKENELSVDELYFMQNIMGNHYKYINKARRKLELYFCKLGDILINNTENFISSKPFYAYSKLKDNFDSQYHNDNINEYYNKLMCVYGTFDIILNTEGFVINYNNELLKITGIFGIINQLIFDKK